MSPDSAPAGSHTPDETAPSHLEFGEETQEELNPRTKAEEGMEISVEIGVEAGAEIGQWERPGARAEASLRETARRAGKTMAALIGNDRERAWIIENALKQPYESPGTLQTAAVILIQAMAETDLVGTRNEGKLQPERIAKRWRARWNREEDRPILLLGEKILSAFQNKRSRELMDELSHAAGRIQYDLAGNDLAGPVIQRLFHNRKNARAYHTLPECAALLAAMAITPDRDWTGTKVADFAAGTGILTMAAHQRIGELQQTGIQQPEIQQPEITTAGDTTAGDTTAGDSNPADRDLHDGHHARQPGNSRIQRDERRTREQPGESPDAQNAPRGGTGPEGRQDPGTGRPGLPGKGPAQDARKATQERQKEGLARPGHRKPPIHQVPEPPGVGPEHPGPPGPDSPHNPGRIRRAGPDDPGAEPDGPGSQEHRHQLPLRSPGPEVGEKRRRHRPDPARNMPDQRGPGNITENRPAHRLAEIPELTGQ